MSTTSKLGADMTRDDAIHMVKEYARSVVHERNDQTAMRFWHIVNLLARQPAAIDNEAAGYTEQFDVDELKRGGVMRVFAAHETDHDIPVYLTTPLEKESNQPVEPKVTITRQQFDAMRVALEVIAVGDSKTPSDTAAHGLVASGFWTDALETENSNSRAASTSANVAQLDMSLEARLTDAEADVKRLHAEKMELWNQVHGYSANVAQGAVAVEAREIQQYVLSVLPSVYYMDPPDGGSVSVLEQLRRMADDAAKYRASTAQTADVAQGEEAVMLDDLSTLVVRLVRVLRKASPDSDLPEKALGYLYRKNLAPAVLRGGAFGEYAAPPAQTAITDDARECLADVVSHYRALYAGLAFQLNEATVSENSDDMTYWKHEIKALERMYAQAERALTAAQSASGDTK